MASFKKNHTFVKLVLLLFFMVTIILPMGAILLNVLDVDIMGVFSNRLFKDALVHSLIATTLATIISVSLATILAYLISRSRIKFKGMVIVLLTLAMLIPSISHGTGLVILLGKNGVITNLLHLNINIYGLLGIVIGSVLYSFPVAFLMIYDIFKYEDHTVYESATVLGVPKMNQIISITLPYLKKPMISVIFATFTLIFTDYGVPLMVGGHFMTLPLYMYNEVIGLLDFGRGAVIALVLIIPAFIAFIFDIKNKDVGNTSFASRENEISRHMIRDVTANLLCWVTILLILLPIITFGLLTFAARYPIDLSFSMRHIERAMSMGAMHYLTNSLLIALLTSAVGVVVAFVTAYFTSRTNTKLSRVLHLISVTTLAIPGIVLGLSYVILFRGTMLQGTLAILIMVNIVHFFASPYLMAYNALGKMNANYESVAKTLGVKRWFLIKDMFIPYTFSTIMEMFSYFFVNAMVTISAVSFLSNTTNQPISMMIPNLQGSMMLEAIAFVSILILGVNILVKTIIYGIKKFDAKKQIREGRYDGIE